MMKTIQKGGMTYGQKAVSIHGNLACVTFRVQFRRSKPRQSSAGNE